MSTRFGQDFEVEVQARFAAGVWPVFSPDFLEVMKLKLVKILKPGLNKFYGEADVWLIF